MRLRVDDDRFYTVVPGVELDAPCKCFELNVAREFGEHRMVREVERFGGVGL